jgi:hypothetical protein
MYTPVMLSKEEFEEFNELLGRLVQPKDRSVVMEKEERSGGVRYILHSHSFRGDARFTVTVEVPHDQLRWKKPFMGMFNHLVKAGVLSKPRVYLLSDPTHGYDSWHPGRVVAEDGTEISSHCSSSAEWLEIDLRGKITDLGAVEVVNLIGQEVPERFRR